MRPVALQAVAVAGLLVLAGCAALPGTTDNGPSPDEFPDDSAVNESVYDSHAALLANTSFTVQFEYAEKHYEPVLGEKDWFWSNSSQRVLVEPGASQYLAQPNGTSNMLGSGDIQRIYSNGTGAYALLREDNESTVTAGTSRVFNESSEYYLWQGWSELPGGGQWMYNLVSENVTFERQGIETFDGVDVMRYEASGLDAGPDWMRDHDTYSYSDFSVALLLDTDGVIRYYEAELNRTHDEEPEVRHRMFNATVTDVGSTDVEKPEWVANATEGS